MKIDLLHNKIVKDTVTDAFCESFEAGLVPQLLEKYGDSILGVQMYEDYLSDGFVSGGRFYYPLTLVLSAGASREWISWSIENKKSFLGKIPFSYMADTPLEFEIEESVPEQFSEKLSARGVYFEGGYAPLSLEYATADKTFLSGKYSQRFIDELNRQISSKIEKAFSVFGIADSGVELVMMFAPGTYMEHVQKEYTYRRLLISARACSARDLWIRWKRIGYNTPITVSDNIPEEELVFEICEDVPQKIREKEYRFLSSESVDKYQEAMGRKRITEWRELVKRVIKRGELQVIGAVEAPLEITDSFAGEEISEPIKAEAEDSELIAKLQETLSAFSAPTAAPVSSESQDDNGDIAAMLKNLLGVEEEQNAEADDPYDALEKEAVSEDAALAGELPIEPVSVMGEIFDSFANSDFGTEPEEAHAPTDFILPDDPTAEEVPVNTSYDEDELRRRIEAEIRAKLELEAKLKEDAETVELRRAHDALKAENERLAALARKAEEEKAAKEAERVAEAEALRREIEARELAEAREKERMAEAARLALLENQRLEAEREAEEKRRRLEAEAAAKLAEEARIEEARRLEAERIRAQMRAEEERTIAAELEKKAQQQTSNYVSKNARLLFRRPIDPNVTKRIHEIILTTIKYFKKENVYIKIKATVPDSTTVNLHFVKIPEEETELLINIIKVLGKSELGIIKAILE